MQSGGCWGRSFGAAADTRQELRCGIAWEVCEDLSCPVEECFCF